MRGDTDPGMAGPQGWEGPTTAPAQGGQEGPQRPCFLDKATAPLCGFLAGNRYLRWVFEELEAQIRPRHSKEASGASARGTMGRTKPLLGLLQGRHHVHSGFGGHPPGTPSALDPPEQWLPCEHQAFH